MRCSARSLAATLLVLAAWAILALAGCSASEEAATSSGSGGGDAGETAASSSAAAVDPASLLTQDDVRAITGITDATPMPESDWNQREGTATYFAIYQGKDSPEALWIRVGHAGMFEEQRGASDMTPQAITGLGDDAFWYDWTGMQKGIAVKVGDSSYLVSTKFLAEKPQLTDAQLEEVARTMVERLQQ